MVEVRLRAVRVDLQSNTPVLLLQETEGEGRTLPIFIGTPEATAIAYALQGVAMPRPMTHDLVKDVLTAMDVDVERVVITELRSSTYYAELHLRRGAERSIVSSRPSDAVAVAVRTSSPLYVSDELMDAEGIILAIDGNDDEDDASPRGAGRPVPPVPRFDKAGRLRLVRAGRLVPVLGALGALVLAGCSSGSPSANSTTTTSSSTSSSTSTSTSSQSSSTTRGPTTTAAGVATCQPGQLTITAGMGNGAAGTISLAVTMVNKGPGTCTMNGYPGMQLLDASGASLPTNVVRGGGVDFLNPAASQPPSLVTLATGQQASFSLSYEDVPVGSETSCPTSAKAEVTPPNDTASAVVAFQASPCGGGTIHVSPVYAG